MNISLKLDTTFKEETGNKLSNTSFLNMFSIYEKDEKFLNIFRNYILNSEIVNDTSYYELYIVENNDWLDQIAYNYYSSPKLWWIIAIANEIYNPFEVLEEGEQIKIIRREYIYQILKEVKEIGEY